MVLAVQVPYKSAAGVKCYGSPSAAFRRFYTLLRWRFLLVFRASIVLKYFMVFRDRRDFVLIYWLFKIQVMWIVMLIKLNCLKIRFRYWIKPNSGERNCNEKIVHFGYKECID